MLPYPVVSAWPVMVKDRVVVFAVWSTCILAFEIWVDVMFPSIVNCSVMPLGTVTGIVFELDDVGVGVGVAVGLAVGVGLVVGETVGETV